MMIFPGHLEAVDKQPFILFFLGGGGGNIQESTRWQIPVIQPFPETFYEGWMAIVIFKLFIFKFNSIEMKSSV